MPIANYTTSVQAARSVAAIQDLLAKAGAQAIMLEYVNQEPDLISFRLMHNGRHLGFKLPCNWRGVLDALNRDGKVPIRLKCNDHAKKVAWRVLHDWLRAQLALVEAGVVEMPQVFMPYAITETGETLYDRLKGSSFNHLALPMPNE